ncbi:hypothetical protein, partial [Aeromonas veronii]|uniref:hypothetical protein n=1 Tax=Aeromonas veronii TaxID=654 RepID=UPI003003FBB1
QKAPSVTVTWGWGSHDFLADLGNNALFAATPASQHYSDCLFLVSLKLHPALPVGGVFLCLTHLF